MNKPSLKSILEQRVAENAKRHAGADQSASTDFAPGRHHVHVALNQIEPNPYQPRRIFDKGEIESLAASITEAGLIQPITVRRLAEDRYQLIAGERRLRAHQLLGRRTIESIVVHAEDGEMAMQAMVENIRREDLTDYEIGKAIVEIEKAFPTKLPRTKLAESLGMKREVLYRYLTFDALPREVQDRLEQNPALLGANGAEMLKKALEGLPKSAKVSAAVKEGLDLIEAGRLEQGKLASHITRQVQASEGAGLQKKDYQRPVEVNGKKVGVIARAGKRLTVNLKLDGDQMSVDQESKLIEFLARLLKSS